MMCDIMRLLHGRKALKTSLQDFVLIPKSLNTHFNFMRKLLLVLTISTIFNFCCYSQTTFERGYFINEDGQKIECLIENVDWKNNPTEFKYKLEGNAESKKADISNVKEFGIRDVCKYIRKKVSIDKSSDDLGKMD